MPAGSHTSSPISGFVGFFIKHRPGSDLCSSFEVHAVSELIVQRWIAK